MGDWDQTTTLSIDLGAIVRRRKAAKHRTQLATRPRDSLVGFADFADRAPPAMMLDTTVYIHQAAGRLPRELRVMLRRVLLFHSSVALAELAVGVANADPARPGWAALRDHYDDVFDTIPARRLLTPDIGIWTDAGVVAGLLARTQGFQPHQRKSCLNDALIYLSAAKAGLPVLTSNRDDFDLIQQVAPEGRVIHY